MATRDQDIKRFLANSPWAQWDVVPIASDASARRYMRLSNANDAAILMDAPPDICHDTSQFITVAALLSQSGLCPPEILSKDLELGIIVLSDLGKVDFASHLSNKPEDEQLLYAAATDTLVTLHDVPGRDDLMRLTPNHGAAMIDVLGQFYTNNDITPIQTELETALTDYAAHPDTLALRDFHSENLIWRPSRTGTDRVGLLDFQDAIVAPAGYDLASLLRDVRRDVSAVTAAAMIDRYCAQTETPTDAFHLQVAILGIQRNLRILGVFARLAIRAGKTRYLKFMDRVWRHILADLDHPEFGALRSQIIKNVPPPGKDHLERILA